jgi:hypothetical protein
VSAFLTIRNWERFQHYKDRSAPWVKLHRDMLTSESWVLGTDRTRVIQLASMMLAPRYSNKIPYRFDLCKKVMSLDCNEGQFTEAIQHLIDTEFLEIQQLPDVDRATLQSASNVLAKCSSEERENRGEGEKIPPTPQGGALAVFNHWKKTWEHPDARLDDRRRGRIEARLKSFSVEQLCDSLSGFRHSDWHTGRDPKGGGKVYDKIETLLRDDSQVEEGLRLYTHPPRPPPKVEQLSPVERVLRANGVNRDERVVAEQFGSSDVGLGDVDRDVRQSPYSGFRRLGS